MSTPTAQDTLAAKLDHLFATVTNPATGRPYSHEDVSEALTAAGGPTISATYLWQLRRGQRTNPRMSHLQALAGHFGVDPAYFFPDLDADLAARLVDDAWLRDPAVREVASLTGRLGARSREVLGMVAAHLSRLERGDLV